MSHEHEAPPTFVDEAREFQEPGAFAVMLERHRRGMTRDQIYRQAGNQEFKDAWHAVMLALGYQEARKKLTEVRICAPDQFPDFQIRIEGKVFDFEATMVLEKGRRIGDDYRGDDTLGPAKKDKPEDLPAFDPEQLVAAIANKVGKLYGARPHLAIYLNVRGKDVQLEDLSTATKTSEADAFKSIWLIVDHHIGCVKTSDELPSDEGWLRVPIK